MKRNVFFVVVALAALFSCSSEENIGIVVPQDVNSQDASSDAIVFSSTSKGVTRADHVGADAANLLDRHFTVGGFKFDTEAKIVFDNYQVIWGENTANNTESNTNDWEYVGYTAVAPAGIAGNKQTVKYWDYLTSYYDFIGYSTGTAEALANTDAADITDNDHVGVTAIDYDNKETAAYTLAGTRVGLAKCYIADMVTVKKADYQNVVKLSFRSLASKVRMALYETVPGYSVKDVMFYVDDTPSIADGAELDEANLYTAGTTNTDMFYTHGTFTVSFPHTGESEEANPDYNVAHVSFAPEDGSSLTTQRFGTLDDQYTGPEASEENDNIYLGRSLNTATFAANKDYTIMMPNEEGTVLALRIDYTLVSTDGSGEEIRVYGAKALVPSTYTQWKPNYAYTYFFKISDNTNGWTSNVTDGEGNPVDPAGLYPITFDATVVDTEEGTQSTITTVSMPSITTYQKGHNIENNEYDASDDIYIQVMVPGASDNSYVLADDLDTKGTLYAVTLPSGTTNVSEADVMDVLNKNNAGNTDSPITGRNGFVLTETASSVSGSSFTTIPGVDGNPISVADGTAAKFAVSDMASGYYAYVYDATPSPAPAVTYYYTAVYLDSRPSDWTQSDLWFDDPNGVTEATAFVPGYYYKKYTNLNKVYGVKVIKVQ